MADHGAINREEDFHGAMVLERAQRKAQLHLLPFLLAGFVNVMSMRTSIAFARVQIEEEFSMSEADYGLFAGIFFIGYCVGQIPSTMMLKAYGGRVVLSSMLILWGVIVMLTTLVTTTAQADTFRFILGLVEAGFLPGGLVFIQFWFSPAMSGRVIGVFVLGFPIGTALGSIVGGVVCTSLDGAFGLSGWQWIMLVEGIPCVCLGLAMSYYLPDGPEDAPWLASEEKKALIAVAPIGRHGDAKNFCLQCKELLFDVSFWILNPLHMLFVLVSFAFTFWLPSIVGTNFPDASTAQMGLAVAIPFLIQIPFVKWAGVLSDESGDHYMFNVTAQVLSFFCLWVMTYLSDLPGFIAFIAMVVFLGMSVPAFWATLNTIFMPEDMVAATALINLFGNIGGFFGPVIFGSMIDAYDGDTLLALRVLAGTSLLFTALFSTIGVLVGMQAKQRTLRVKYSLLLHTDIETTAK